MNCVGHLQMIVTMSYHDIAVVVVWDEALKWNKMC